MAAAASSLLLVPAVVAGDGVALVSFAQGEAAPVQPTDPDQIGADGSLAEGQRVGDEVLQIVNDPALLATVPGAPVSLPDGPVGIPGAALQAYMQAEKLMAISQPNCHMSWPLLASIGRIESNHARGGRVDEAGNTLAPILGPVLNGGGFAAIRDTDGGAYDGNSTWDRAVGPMQFIPSTWRGYASDGNGDGVANPSNLYDATLAAGKYLCSGGLNTADPRQRATAIFRYNHSDSYVRTVMVWADAYARGVKPLPMSQVPSEVIQQALANPPVVPPVVTPPSTGTSAPPSPSTTTTPPSSTTTTSPTTTTTSPGCTPTSTTTTTHHAADHLVDDDHDNDDHHDVADHHDHVADDDHHHVGHDHDDDTADVDHHADLLTGPAGCDPVAAATLINGLGLPHAQGCRNRLRDELDPPARRGCHRP